MHKQAYINPNAQVQEIDVHWYPGRKRTEYIHVARAAHIMLAELFLNAADILPKINGKTWETYTLHLTQLTDLGQLLAMYGLPCAELTTKAKPGKAYNVYEHKTWVHNLYTLNGWVEIGDCHPSMPYWLPHNFWE